MDARDRRDVTVVGGGITGLLTAAHLADAGVRVTVLEGRHTVGGQIRSIALAGSRVDVGAESLHLGAPGVLELLRRVGLDGDLVDAESSTTWVATRRGLRTLPAGMGPAGPTRLWPVATSRVLSPAGLLRAAAEPFLPDTRPWGDVAVGTYLTRRFGRQLTQRLVDPLLGNLHAGDVHRLSLAAAAPQLDAAARRSRSLVLDRRRQPITAPPRFVTVAGGLRRITDRLATDPRVDVRCSTPVVALAGRPDGYDVATEAGPPLRADAVVLAVPAAAAARLVASLDRPASRLLGDLETASVVTAVVAYRTGDVDRSPVGRANGLLVPSGSGRILKAATFLSHKWAHLATDGTTLVRLSAGRAGEDHIARLTDDELLAALVADLADLTGLTATPTAAVVERWPDTMPQLVTGHQQTMAAVRRRLAGHRITLAGAAYDGVGIASCIRAAEHAGRSVLASAPQEQLT